MGDAAAANRGTGRPLGAHDGYLGYLATASVISKAYAINDELQLAGSGTVPSGLHAMFWRSDVAMIDVGDLPHGTAVDSATAYSVAEGGGHVVGSGLAGTVEHAFLWNYVTRPTIRDLGDLPGEPISSHAWDVNREAVVVGDSGVPMGNHACLDRCRWHGDLGDLQGGVAKAASPMRSRTRRASTVLRRCPAISSAPARIRAAGAPSGWPAPSATGMSYGAPIDLNTQLSPANSAVTLTEAKGINRFGIISAKGVTGGVSTSIYWCRPMQMFRTPPA